MNAFDLSRFLLLPCIASAVLLFTSAPCIADDEAGPTVTATLDQKSIKVASGHPVKIKLVVKNNTTQPWKFTTWSCGWVNEWEPDNRRIAFGSWACTANRSQIIELPPGASFTDQIELAVINPVVGEKISFRLGFTAEPHSPTVWSNAVKIEIGPPDPLQGDGSRKSEAEQISPRQGIRTLDEHCKVTNPY